MLAGDHIYKMDYGRRCSPFMRASGAECTVACIEVPLEEASGFGVMAVDGADRIADFVEKPARAAADAGRPDHALASMGIYAFNAAFLYEELRATSPMPGSSRDFGKDIIPPRSAAATPCASLRGQLRLDHPGAEPYWRDVGTIDAYWAANLDLSMPTPLLDIYDRSWPIWTYQEQLPPAKFVFDDDDRRGVAIDSMVSGGLHRLGRAVRRSLLFSRVRVNSYCRRPGGGAAAGRRGRPPCPADQGGGRSRLPHPGGPGGRRGPRRRCAAVLPQRRWRRPDQPRYARRVVNPSRR